MKESNEDEAGLKKGKGQSKALSIEVVTETPDVTGLAVFLNNEPLDYINLFKDSKAERVAYEFCVKNQLSYDYLQAITDQLKWFINRRSVNAAKKNQSSFDDLPESPLESNKERVNTGHEYKRPSSTNGRGLVKTIQTEIAPSRKAPFMFPLEQYQRHKTLTDSAKASKSKQKKNLSKSKTVQNTQGNESEKHDHNDDIHIKNQIELRTIINSKLSKKHHIQSSSSSKVERKSNCLPMNFGERLFHKGVKLKTRANDKLQANEAAKENQLTFQPKTNAITFNALSKRFINRKSYDDNKTIINYKDYVNDRITVLRQKHNYQPQYTFEPELDKNSLAIENTKEANKDKRRYEHLYENYKHQLVNKEKLSKRIYNKDTLFRPSINEYECAYTAMSFDDRQGYFSAKSIEKKKENKEIMEANIIKETGKPFFQPKINDYQPLTEYRPTFNDLYLDSSQLKSKLKEKEEMSNELFHSMQNSSHMNKESNEIFEEMKEKTFIKIFKCLDKNQEGLITHIYMDTKSLPKNISDILSPIFTELKEENVTLNEAEFASACFHLFEVLPYLQRKELLSFNLKPKTPNPNQFTFKPSINNHNTRSKLNKSTQSIQSITKSDELNSIRKKIIDQHYTINSPRVATLPNNTIPSSS